MNSLSSLLSLLAGVLIFCGACYLVKTKRRPAVLAAYLVLLPLPVLISLCGSLSGQVSSLSVIAATPNLNVTTADVAAAVADTLLGLLVALLISAPTYFLLAFGLLIRILRSPGDSANLTPTCSVPQLPQPNSSVPMPAPV